MPEKSKSIKLTRSRHSVLPEVETLISIQTHPKAVCSLVHDEVKDRHLQLDADDHGIVHFHVKARKDWKPVEIHLEYTGENGQRARHTIALRADTGHDAPISPNEVVAAPPGSLRPPLTGDPMALSTKELVSRGYPPRPDQARSPARYARWLRKVSRPFTAVTPRLVPHPEVSFAHPAPAPRRAASFARPHPPPPQLMSPTLPLPPPMLRPMFNNNSGIWSGAYLTGPVAQFYYIQGDWNVPGVFPMPGFSPAYSAAAEWIGLDNSATDLYQSGTDSECWDLSFFGFNWTFTNYWMWIESLPFAPWAVTNFPISPGDSISVDIFVADQNGTTWFQNGSYGGLTQADNSVWFMLYNNTKGLSYWGTLPTASQSLGGQTSTPFTGSTAEFIVERPTVNGSAVPLAFFALATMQSCWYGDSQYGEEQLFALGADGSSPFDGNLAYLNMQNGSTNDLLDIAISVPDPTSPQGSEILWLWTNYQ